MIVAQGREASSAALVASHSMRLLTYNSAFLFIATLLVVVVVGVRGLGRGYFFLTNRCHIGLRFPCYIKFSSHDDLYPYALIGMTPEMARSVRGWRRCGVSYYEVTAVDFWRVGFSFWHPLLLFAILPSVALCRRYYPWLRGRRLPARPPFSPPRFRFSLSHLALAAGLIPVLAWIGFAFVPLWTLLATLLLCAASAAITIIIGGFSGQPKDASRAALVSALLLYFAIVALGLAAKT